MRKLYAVAIVVAGLATAFPALAVDNSLSLKQAMTQFGLIGEWAAQCSQPPGKDNAHTHWLASSQTDGELVTDFGGAHTMTYAATAAELLGADRIRVELVNNQDATHLELIIEKRAGRTRTLSSVRSDGRALITDGKLVAIGADTVVQERCN